MKLAVIGNFDKEISPNSKGGTELFTYSLVRGLISKPSIESIIVFGVGRNHFEDKKVTFIPLLQEERVEFTNHNEFLRKLSVGREDFDAELRFGIASKITKLMQKVEVDLIHDNSTSLVFTSLTELLPAPIITTLHTNVMSPSIMIPYYLGLLHQPSSKQFFVSIANHQKKFAQENNIHLNIFQTVYNGLDISGINLKTDTSNQAHGLWLGRVKRKHNKGLKETVLVAKEFKKDINIVAQVDDKEYYAEEIEPNLSSNTHLIPEPKTVTEKNNLYAKSGYFIYPVQWEEPFGLVFLEAMAAGTPVIAFAKGAVCEVIADGKTGFIVNSSVDDIRGDWITKKTGLEGLNEAIERIQSMSSEEYVAMRQACRKHVEDNFTIDKMVDGYEEVYKKILNQV